MLSTLIGFNLTTLICCIVMKKIQPDTFKLYKWYAIGISLLESIFIVYQYTFVYQR